jgi:hypothetical protein
MLGVPPDADKKVIIELPPSEEINFGILVQ